MSDKIKVISGIFKGMESYGNYYAIDLSSGGFSTITFHVDYRNKITVDLIDVEMPKPKKKYLLYIEREGEFSEFISVEALTEKEMSDKSFRIFHAYKTKNCTVIAQEVDKIKFEFCGKKISKDNLKKILESI